MAVFFVYAPRRVGGANCGVKVERVPWAEGKSRLTKTFQWFLASLVQTPRLATGCSVIRHELADRLSLGALGGGLGVKHRSLDHIEAVGVDEVQWQKGHHYLTLVYQIDGNCRELLHIAPERSVRSLLSFFRLLGETRSKALRFVCSDMWQPYLKVVIAARRQAKPCIVPRIDSTSWPR